MLTPSRHVFTLKLYEVLPVSKEEYDTNEPLSWVAAQPGGSGTAGADYWYPLVPDFSTFLSYKSFVCSVGVAIFAQKATTHGSFKKTNINHNLYFQVLGCRAPLLTVPEKCKGKGGQIRESLSHFACRDHWDQAPWGQLMSAESRGIVLDIDGTLIDSMPWPCDSVPHQPAHIVEVGFVCTMNALWIYMNVLCFRIAPGSYKGETRCWLACPDIFIWICRAIPRFFLARTWTSSWTSALNVAWKNSKLRESLESFIIVMML